MRTILSSTRGATITTGAAGAVAVGVAGAAAAGADVLADDGASAGAVADDAPPLTALTAVWHADERLDAFFCRQDKAADPPGDTPEQYFLKSPWQEFRIALC